MARRLPAARLVTDVRLGFASLAAGQYLPLDSTVHRMDARLKLGLGLVLVGMLFATRRWGGLGLFGCGLVAAVWLSRVPISYLWRFMRPFVVILAITLFFQTISLPGDALFTVGPLTFTRSGLEQGGLVVSRLALILLSGALLVVTTSPVAVTDAVAWYLRPFRRLGIPDGDLAMVTSLALRFIPVLMAEFEQLVKAQRARGVSLELRSPLRAGRALMPLMVPLFVLGFRRAEELADAMLSRCYQGTEGRTHYREMHFTWRDGVWLTGAVLWLGGALALGRGWVLT